jgi:radical SAM superfamily enzyme YgiQ (UPF0313 family)
LNVLLLNPVARDGTRSLRVGRCQGKVIVGLWPNVEYGILGAMLEREGFRPVLLDANHEGLDFENMIRRARDVRPAVIFLLSITATLDDDLEAGRRLAQAVPGARIIYWGTHATARPEDYLGREGAVVIRREPDLTALEVCRALRDDANGDLASIPGVSTRDSSGIRHGPHRPFLDDLDSLPMASHSLMGTGRHRAADTRQPFALIKTSRGCPHRCVFCTTHAFHGARWRARSPEAIVDEISFVRRTTGVGDFFLQSDVFSQGREWTAELCERIARADLGISWFCNSRVDTLDESLLAGMRAAGCRLVAFGVESGSDAVLAASRKGATADLAARTIAAARAQGMPTLTYWVFGLPGETPETMAETHRFIRAVHPDYAHFYSPTPLPGTELFRMQGLDDRVASGEVAWADFFQGVSAAFVAPTVTAAQVESAIRRAYIEFYTDPRRLLREIRQLGHPGRALARLETFRDMVRNYVLR